MVNKNRLHEVQPLDPYVRILLARVALENSIEIADPENPTRGERLAAALSVANENHGFSAMEIMVGRRISSGPEDQTYHMMMLVSPKDADFLDGFAHCYWERAVDEE